MLIFFNFLFCFVLPSTERSVTTAHFRCMMAWMQSRPQLFLFHWFSIQSFYCESEKRNQYAWKMKAALSQSKMKVNMQRQRDRETAWGRKLYSSQIHFQSNIQSNKQAPRLLQSQEMAQGASSHPRPWSQTLIKSVIIPPALMVSNHTVTVRTKWNLDIYDPFHTDQHSAT